MVPCTCCCFNSGPQKADRSVIVQIANLSVNQTYFVKVQADYGNVNGPWSEQLKIEMKGNHFHYHVSSYHYYLYLLLNVCLATRAAEPKLTWGGGAQS